MPEPIIGVARRGRSYLVKWWTVPNGELLEHELLVTGGSQLRRLLKETIGRSDYEAIVQDVV